MKRKKVLCTVLAAMMIASMATGCGGNDDGKAGGLRKKVRAKK